MLTNSFSIFSLSSNEKWLNPCDVIRKFIQYFVCWSMVCRLFCFCCCFAWNPNKMVKLKHLTKSIATMLIAFFSFFFVYRFSIVFICIHSLFSRMSTDYLNPLSYSFALNNNMFILWSMVKMRIHHQPSTFHFFFNV